MRSRSGTDPGDPSQAQGRFSPLPAITWPLLRTHLLALLVLGLAGFGFLVGTSGSYAGRVSAVLACLALLQGYALLVIATVRRRSTAFEAVTTDEGIVIRGLRTIAVLLVAMLICAAGFPIAFAIGVFRDDMAPGSSGMFAMSLIVELILIPVVAMLLLGRFRMNRLVLTRSAVEYVGYRHTRTAEWADFDRVEIRERPRVEVVLSGRAEEFSVPFGLLAAGPVPLAEHLDDLMRSPKNRPLDP